MSYIKINTTHSGLNTGTVHLHPDSVALFCSVIRKMGGVPVIVS